MAIFFAGFIGFGFGAVAGFIFGYLGNTFAVSRCNDSQGPAK